MPRAVGGPLSESDYQKLNQTLAGLENTRHEIQMALQAGLDCAQTDALCQDLQKRLNQIKGIYFPQHP